MAPRSSRSLSCSSSSGRAPACSLTTLVRPNSTAAQRDLATRPTARGALTAASLAMASLATARLATYVPRRPRAHIKARRSAGLRAAAAWPRGAGLAPLWSSLVLSGGAIQSVGLIRRLWPSRCAIDPAGAGCMRTCGANGARYSHMRRRRPTTRSKSPPLRLLSHCLSHLSYNESTVS